MSKVLVISTHGSDDPTRSSLAWLFAKGAVEAGHTVQILLSGDAAIIARRVVADSVQGVGIPSMKELTAFALERNVPVFV